MEVPRIRNWITGGLRRLKKARWPFWDPGVPGLALIGEEFQKNFGPLVGDTGS